MTDQKRISEPIGLREFMDARERQDREDREMRMWHRVKMSLGFAAVLWAVALTLRAIVFAVEAFR